MSFMRRLWGREPQDADSAGQSDQEPVQPALEETGEASEPAGTEELTDPSSTLPDPDKHCGVGLNVGYASDVGRTRDHNEDTLIAFEGIHLGHKAADPFGLFIVSDGMGGHQAGEVASALAARHVTHQALNKIYLPFLLGEAPGADMDPITEILKRAVEEANEKVNRQVPGGGTTLTSALVLGHRAYIAHVGDSRAYLLADQEMRQLTQDHSFVGRLMELGELSAEEANAHPQRHVLYRAVGQGENLDIDTYQYALPGGCRLLLCSDGLSGVLSDEEIERTIRSEPSPQAACDRLVEAANAAGGPDNVTAILIETPCE